MTTKVVIKPNHFTYNGIAYFRANADTVRLGAYGEKRSPLTKANYLEVKGMVPAPKLDAIEATVVDIDFKQSSASDITVDAHPAQLEFAGGSVSAARQAASQGKLKLVKLHMLNNDMEKAINASPQVLDNLNDYGNNARVAHQIWVIMEAETADRVKTNSSASVKATIEGITIGLNGSTQSSRETEITIKPGATYGYLLGKFDWNASSKKNRTQVTDIDDDQWSFS
jgi:hypothetical protein